METPKNTISIDFKAIERYWITLINLMSSFLGFGFHSVFSSHYFVQVLINCTILQFLVVCAFSTISEVAWWKLERNKIFVEIWSRCRKSWAQKNDGSLGYLVGVFNETLDRVQALVSVNPMIRWMSSRKHVEEGVRERSVFWDSKEQLGVGSVRCGPDGTYRKWRRKNV